MCEGSRVKMGYVTYGVGGEKHTKTKVRLKKHGGTYTGRKTGGEEREKVYERRHTKRDRGRVCV